MRIPLPRLLDGKTLAYIRDIRPIRATVELNIIPLSTASIELPEEETLPTRGFVEMFVPQGSAGIYRIRSPQNSYGDNDNSISELEHAVTEVGDWLVLNEYSEMMTPGAAMTTLFGHYRGNKWKLGSVSALGTGQVALQADHDDVLSAMLAVLSQVPSCVMTFDFSTTPWTINFAKRDTVVSAEGRLSRNVQGAKIIYDDSELCTRCYYEYDNGAENPLWAYLDSDTIGIWGQVEKTVSTGGNYSKSEALRVARDYINKHKNPRISVSIDAYDLSVITGETFDTFQIGKLFRLELPDYKLTISECITQMSWDDVYENPNSISITLGEEENSAITFLHEMVATGGSVSAGGSGGGGGKKQQDDTWKKFKTNFHRTDMLIDLNAQHFKENRDILQQAGLYLDANGTLMYADDNENNIYSKLRVTKEGIISDVQALKKDLQSSIKQTADAVAIIVEGTGPNAKIKPASIVAAINGSSSSVTISADKILLDGKATVKSLLTGNAGINKLLVYDLLVGSGTGMGAVNAKGAWITTLDLKLEGNTYYLKTYTLASASPKQTLTFSRATSLSGKWSGGTYKVTASPQGAINRATIKQLRRTTTNVSVSGTFVGQPFEVFATANDGTALVNTGFPAQTIWIDASKVYEAGKRDAPHNIIAGGTVYVDYSQPSGTQVGSAVNAAFFRSGANYLRFTMSCGNSSKTFYIQVTN